jgi:DNA-binding NarL/FixJ family response regulator
LRVKGNNMSSLGVLIVDDHPLFRKGMRALLDSMPGTQVIGEAKSGQEAVEMAAHLKPDVVLMDLQMPQGNGLTATRELTRINPDLRILVVTLFEDDDSIFAALRAGARGYILKDADEDEMMRAIRSVGEGEAIFSPAIATRLIDYFGEARRQVPPEVFPELTEREREILSLIARGDTNPEIAEQLTLTLKTVRNHVSNIYSKLQVANRAQAAIRAKDAGLG